jgi:hypothetical protein
MKTKQIYLLAGIGALLLIILNWDRLMAFARNTKSSVTPNQGGAGKTNTVVKDSPNWGPSNPSELLHKGSTGASVKELQQMIIDGWGSAMLPKYGADGDFGSETEKALVAITHSSSTNLTEFRMNYYDKQKSNPQSLSFAPGTGVDSDYNAFQWLNPVTWFN